ncbi:MAG: amino acid ABC transporter permease [Tyzzerella sp.]|uniref:Amino acid ABC transporter permease n=1 Tax=Candidatus Fimicola merdigallinarum TaxID=2840819 RepID=A0A9D9DWA6_9FIRM|nr:amino acid ABC transporter permease [Candidatus Fimicola merdigallinarum]
MDSIFNYFVQIGAGLEVTLKVFAVCIIFSIPLGIIVALCRLSKNIVIRKIAETYIWVLRGTPLLLQIMFVFFGLPVIGISLGSNRLMSAYIPFVLNYAAYFGEIFRSGIQSIEKGQREAASILGFTPFQINMKIVLPQVFKRTLPSVGNEIITLVKDTSLVYIIGLNDVLKLSKGIANRDVTLLPFVVAGVMYLVMTFVITKVLEKVENKVIYEE